MKRVALAVIVLMLGWQSQAYNSTCLPKNMPIFTDEEIEPTAHWGVGMALAMYAHKAGYKWDGKAYEADSPNMGLWWFGFATGRECLPVDITYKFNGAFTHLSVQWGKWINPEKQATMELTFRELFTNIAASYGMEKYLVDDTIDYNDNSEGYWL